MPSWVLSHRDMASLLSTVRLSAFFADLADEIERVYTDRSVESIKRIGWTRAFDTLEVMGCEASDLSCIKGISSMPSGAGPATPTVTGTLMCIDARSREPRLVCNAAVLTSLRTAASTAVVLRRISPQIRSVGVIGAGVEGSCHAVALALLLPSVRRITLADIVPDHTRQAIDQVTELLAQEGVLADRHIEIEGADIAEKDATHHADAIVTATYGRSEVLESADSLRPGTVIAAVGADLTGKRELGFSIYDRARFIADDLRQCFQEGELEAAGRHLGIPAPEKGHGGVLADGRIIGVSDLLDNNSPFLARPEPIVVYDSTGFSGQDLAAARVILRLLEAQQWEPSEEWDPVGAETLVDQLGRSADRATLID
jgi:ornithine cyclodeaminase